MTDYTPLFNVEVGSEELAVLFAKPATVQQAKDWRDLIFSAPRLKQERDELLEMLKADASTLEAQVYRFRRIGESHKELDLAIKETRELIAKVEK